MDGACRESCAATSAEPPGRGVRSRVGACHLLMAASSNGVLSRVGVGSGIGLIAASCWPNPRRRALMGLILGTVPFAALGWTALVPVLPMLVTATVAVRLVRETGPAGVCDIGTNTARVRQRKSVLHDDLVVLWRGRTFIRE